MPIAARPELRETIAQVWLALIHRHRGFVMRWTSQGRTDVDEVFILSPKAKRAAALSFSVVGDEWRFTPELQALLEWALKSGASDLQVVEEEALFTLVAVDELLDGEGRPFV